MDEPIPRYFMMGGLPIRIEPSTHEARFAPDTVMLDNVLRSIEWASAEVRCDHGLPIMESCLKCEEAGYAF